MKTKIFTLPNYKALVLGLSIISCSLFFTNSQANAQCTPKVDACQIENPRLPACIDPDTGATAFLTKPYTQTIQLLLGRTIKQGNTEVYLSRLDVKSVTKVPDGLSTVTYSGNPTDPINGKSTGNVTPKDEKTPMHICSIFSGTPTTKNAVTNSVEIEANIYVKLIILGQITGGELDPNQFAPGTNPIKFKYRIGVSDPSSIENQIKSKLLSLNLSPNPSQNFLNVDFTLPMGADVEVSVLDATGKEVMNEKFSALDAGRHLLPLSISHLSEGVYSLHLKSLGMNLTEKFVK